MKNPKITFFHRKTPFLMLMLALLLSLVTVMSACSQTKTEGTENSGSVTEAPKATDKKADNSAAPKKLNILLSHAEAVYAKQAQANDPYIKELNRLSGYDLNFEFLGHSDYAQQLSLRFASKDLADLIRTDEINSSIHKGAVDQGVFLELGPLIDKYAPDLKNKIPESAWNSPRVTRNGKIYGIPVLTGVPADRIVFIRQDWLDKLGMKQPQSLDEYLKFFEAVKNTDLNGNGVHDEYGAGFFSSIGWGNMFSQAFGVTPGMFNLHNGQLVPDDIDPRMKDVLKFYKMLYDKGYINKDLFTKKEDEHNASIAKGEVGSWGAAVYQYSAGYGAEAAKKTFVNQPGASVSMIAPPKGPDGAGGMAFQDDGIYFVWTIPATAKNPEEVLKFLNWAWTSPEADKFFAYGIKDHNYTEENGKVKYDANNPVNADKNAFQMYQLSLNVREIGFASKLVLETLPEAEKIIKGYDDAKQHMNKTDSIYMPRLESLATKPELKVGFGNGLFYELFAKVVTGKAPVDKAFDSFVAEWKKRGGDAVIKEATDWYNNFHKK